MRVTIDDILAKENKTRYWLAEEIKSTYPTIMNLCNNKTSSINFEVMVKICKALNCTPNDLFDIN